MRYDGRGNMVYGPLNGEMTEFVYDVRNRLIRAGDTTYEYDAEDRRTAAVTAEYREEYVVDPVPALDRVLEIRRRGTGGEENVTTCVYGNELIREESKLGTSAGVAASAGETVKTIYHHYDQVGSTVVLTDGTGAITQEYEYGSYGELIRGDKKATRFLYNGAYGVMTDDNGLYYMRARYYNVSIRRFINQDVLEGSLTNSQSLNRYSYVQGNPVSLSDPFGLSPYMSWSEKGHFILDMVGFIPGVGDVVDVLNAVWYALEGNWGMAGVSLMSAIPGIGSVIGQGVKLTVKGIDIGCAIAKTSKVIGYGYSSIRAGEAAGNGVINMLDKYLVRKEALGWDTLGEAGQVTLHTVAAVVSGKASVASSAARVCFTGETLVETSEGQKRIDEIQEGEYVLSENPETKEISYRRVETVFENETETLIHVNTEKEQITTTPNHPFYVEGMGFVEAKDLKAGDRLKDADGRSVLVTSVEREGLEEAVRVYNLEVEEDHTYYVGTGKVLVHNRCDGGIEGKSDTEVKTDTYKNMSNDPSITGQAHHLNQDAAFRDVIPRDAGLSVELNGNAFTDVGSSHYNAHSKMENFWNNYRKGGDSYGMLPTVGEYNRALYSSLQEAGFSTTNSANLVVEAFSQQRYYDFSNSDYVPRVPGRINQKR